MSNTQFTLASAVALTTTPTASSKAAKVKHCNNHSIYVLWTPGTSGNVLTLTVETSPDGGTTWFQDMQLADSSGTKTRQLVQFQHTATGTTATYHRIDLTDIESEEIRVKYSESEAGGATKGTITVNVLSASR